MWTPETQTSSAGSVDAMKKAVEYIRKAGIPTKRIAAEFGFLPFDASKVLRAAFPMPTGSMRSMCWSASAPRNRPANWQN